jgi:hypothetical protein
VSRLFSYVVHHDYGIAPNPYGAYCTLALCKFGSPGWPNLVELAKPGDWVAGTGGAGPDSAGHGKLIYAMRVDEKLTLAEYASDPRFADRADNLPELADRTDRYVLVSRHFFYFGARAIELRGVPARYLSSLFEKRGPGYRYKDFLSEFVADFADWLEETYHMGIHGNPCAGRPAYAPRCVSRQIRLRVASRVRQAPAWCGSGRV